MYTGRDCIQCKYIHVHVHIAYVRTIFPRINAAVFIYFAPAFAAVFIRGWRLLLWGKHKYVGAFRKPGKPKKSERARLSMWRAWLQQIFKLLD